MYPNLNPKQPCHSLLADVQARTLAGAKCATVQGLQNYRASKFTQYTKFLDDRKLLSSCVNLEVKLKSERSDIDGRELYVELKFIQDHIDRSMDPLDILKYLKQHGSFPDAIIAYIILLTIPMYCCICGKELF